MNLSDPKIFNVLRHDICKELNNVQFEKFMMYCERTKLDPIIKQIYPIMRKGVLTIQTSIEGFRWMAERTGKYAPGRASTFETDSNGELISATSYLKKMTEDGVWHEVSATAFLSEYVQCKANGEITAFWAKMPRGQLSKCAESLALRKAFSELSGLYTDDEMENSISEPPAGAIVDPGVNEGPSESSSYENLELILKESSLPSEKLKEWICLRSKLKSVSEDLIVENCLKVPEAFRRAYKGWLAELDLVVA